MVRPTRDLIGNSAIRRPNYHGQSGVPMHMLTLADLQELQEMQNGTMEGGKFNLKKFFRPIGKALASKDAKKVFSTLIDTALPIANKSIAKFTGEDEKDIANVTGYGRKVLKKKTGYGKLPKQHDGVGMYTPQIVPVRRQVTPRTKKAPVDDKRKRRGQVVSQLMKEHGLSLAAASKYIKEHGIAY